VTLEGVQAFPYSGRGPLRLDFASLLGPLFFMWLLQLMLPVRSSSAAAPTTPDGSDLNIRCVVGCLVAGSMPTAMLCRLACHLGAQPCLNCCQLGVTVSVSSHACVHTYLLHAITAAAHYTGIVTSSQVNVATMVAEKESGMRALLHSRGLTAGAHYAGTAAWQLLMYGLYVAIMAGSGYGLGLQVYRRTSLAVQVRGVAHT
jgi:hypothetical protein